MNENVRSHLSEYSAARQAINDLFCETDDSNLISRWRRVSFTILFSYATSVVEERSHNINSNNNIKGVFFNIYESCILVLTLGLRNEIFPKLFYGNSFGVLGNEVCRAASGSKTTLVNLKMCRTH